MFGISNESIQAISGIVQAITPILVIIIGWFISKDKDVFNLKRILKFNLSDYQYNIYVHEAFFSLVNPTFFLIEFLLSLAIAMRIPSGDYVKLLWFILIYISSVAIMLAAEAGMLHRRKKRLKMIADSISKEFSEMMLSIDKEKYNMYKINMIILSAIWLLLFFTPNITVWSTFGVWDIIALFWIIYYLISENYMSRRKAGYNTKAKIKSKTIINLDLTKYYKCYLKMVLREDCSFKFQDDRVIIYYPGDISSYTIKQDNLINITVGYRVEYFNADDNKYI